MPAVFDDLWPWEIGVIVDGYARRREDEERVAFGAAHALAQWVWLAFNGRLQPLDELLVRADGRRGAATDPEARTALDEARFTAWAHARTARQAKETT